MNSLSQHAPDAGLKRLCERLNADKVKCIPGALNLFRPAHKACEAGRVFSPSRRDTAPMMLKHVGESLQRPRSQLLHQILHFWIQHPVLGKMALCFFEANAAPLSCSVRLLSCPLANREEGPNHHRIFPRYRYQSGSCSHSNHSCLVVVLLDQ